MSQWIYEYECTLPLVYNRYDIRSIEEQDSEQRFGLKSDICWSKPYSVELDYEERIYAYSGEIQFCIHCTRESDSNMPEREFTIAVKGMVHQSQMGAYKLFAEDLQYICYGLSLMLSRHNANKQAYQHRVKADYDKMEWKQWEHEPFIEWADLGDKDEVQVIDGKEIRVITVRTSPIQMGVSTYVYMYQDLNPEEFWSYYRENMDESQKYLVHEYYLALGTESSTSKLYHLCSMIEYIEQKYAGMAECGPLYQSERKQDLLLQIKELPAYQTLEGNQQKRFMDVVSKHLNEATDMGRDEKLCRILWNMDIREIKLFDRTIPINKKYVHTLTDMRNIYFHGKKAKEQSVDGVIVELLQLGLLLVEWVLRAA